jgi:hypothetical protein
MSTDTADVGGEVPTTDPAVVIDSDGDTGTTPDFETTARDKGWKPKDEWEADPEEWIDAKEFIKRQPLFDKIKNLNKRHKELEKTINGMAQHYNISVAQAKQRAISELMEKKREAIEVGDVAQVATIEQNIASVHQTPNMTVPQQSLAPEIQDFVAANKEWFNKDAEMTNFAVSFNETYLKSHPGELDSSLAETMKAVKRAYPDKFVKSATSNTVSDGGTQTSRGKYDTRMLDSDQKLAYNQYVKVHKIMSHDDYFKSLDDAGYLNKK